MKKTLFASLAALVGSAALAAPVTYNIDPEHTFPSFEADHMGGMSIWRGKIKSSSGRITLDTVAKSGTVDVTMNMASIDFGHDGLNKHAASPDIFDVARFPTATFKGTLAKFNGDAPTEVTGQLTMHGVTKPVTLKVNQFKCAVNPMTMADTCGADAIATINRADFGVTFGTQMGFKPEVTLRIQVEAIKAT
jgi:polyisoprenoid-binding protein YceI